MRKKLKITGISVLSVIVLFAVVFFTFVSIGQHKAEDVAVQIMKNDDVRVDGNFTILSAATPSDKAFIFYPGAKVEAIAYLPLLEKLRQQGITCILVEMPFNLAMFGINDADRIIAKFPDIKEWYIGGHSLGGAMASSYASNHQDEIKGVVLLGAYAYGDIPKEKTLTVYGSNDIILNKSKIDYIENVFSIEGGNHSGFGNYKEQKGDGEALISQEQQQDEAVSIVMDFINSGE